MADERRFALRRGLAEEWESANPVLADGEPGLEVDTGQQKVGDGVRPWLQLPYNTVSLALAGQSNGLATLDPTRRITRTQMSMLAQHGQVVVTPGTDVTVQFPGAFDAQPAVVVNVQSKDPVTVARYASARDVSTTGFTVTLVSTVTTPFVVTWLALGVGEPAPERPPGAPSQPTAVTVSKNDANRTGTITWAPPLDLGSPKPPATTPVLLGYQAFRDGVDASGEGAYTSPLLDPSLRTFTFTNLDDATYQLGVQAVNWVGPGLSAGGSITLVAEPPPPPPPPGVPSVPTSLVATKDDALRRGTISWQPPTSDGGSPITGYYLSRDGVDAAGAGAYTSPLQAATLRTFTFTNLAYGATYKLTVVAVNAAGNGVPGTVTVTMPPDPGTAAVQKTGPEYVLEQNLTGDLHQKINGHSLILSLQPKVYTESNFDRPYGSTTTVMKPDGSGLNPTAYWSMMYQGKTIKGVVGASMKSTIIEIAPSSSTKNPGYTWGLDGAEGRTTFGSNFLQMWATLDHPVDLVYKDFTLRGTPQGPVAGIPPTPANGNDGQGHDYNGWYLARPVGNVYVENVTVTGVPGSGSSPPGETFIASLLGLKAGKKATFKNFHIDGTNQANGKKVGAAGLGLNTIDGLVEIDGGSFNNTRYSGGIAAWKIGAASVVNIRNTRMFGMRRTLGAEAVAGVINVYDPVWGPVQDTRFDINLTWALLKNGVIYKNGKINFYFSSETAWQNFNNARKSFIHTKNVGRPGLIRVVTNTKEDYGYGVLPTGTYNDPWKSVLVWFKNPTTGVYEQRPAANYVDFFGVHTL